MKVSFPVAFFILLFILCGGHPEQYSVTINFNEKSNDPFVTAIIISVNIQCALKNNCQYQVVISNGSPTYFDVKVNDKICPVNNCNSAISFNQSINITITRPNFVLDVFDFMFVDPPLLVMLGCTMLDSDDCYYRETFFYDQVVSRSCTDSVCVCRNTPEACADQFIGECAAGYVEWWKPIGYSSSSRQTIPSTSQSTTKKLATTALSTTPIRTTVSTTRTSTPSTVATTTTPKPTTTSKFTTTTKTSTSTTTTPIPTTTADLTLKQLSDDGVGLNNITAVLNETWKYSKIGPDLSSTQISEITNILKNSANLVGISSQNSEQILKNMDCLLNATEKEMVKSGGSRQTLLTLLKSMVENTNGTDIRFLEGTNIGFSSKQIDCANLKSTDGLLDLGSQFELINETSIVKETKLNAIMVPIDEICSTQQVSHLYFSIHRHRKLFTGKQQYRTFGQDGKDLEEFPDEQLSSSISKAAVENDTDGLVPLLLPPPSKCSSQISVAKNTPVMSATLLNNGETISAIQSRPVMANLQFNINHIPIPLHGSFRVTWWDVGRQTWSTDRPCTIISMKNGIVNASCEHLTDFTVIVDGSLNDRIVCDPALITTGYVVNSISIVSLVFLTIIMTLVYIKSMIATKVLFYLRGQVMTKGDLVNLAYYAILLLFFVSFVFFADQSEIGNKTTCTVTAAFMYFLLISSIMLNLLQGVRTIYTFFPERIRAFFDVMVSPPAALTIGIVVPFMLSLLLAVFNSEFFERNDSFCWVRPDYITYAIVVPISILLLNAVICSAFVTYKMFFAPQRKLSKGESNYYDAEFWSKIGSLIIMQISLGVPWVIQYFTLQWPTTTFWHYLFTIILGSQGTILLLIFFYRRQKLIGESRRSSERTKKMNNSVNSYHESNEKKPTDRQ